MKERLTGAIILVVLIVLLVPELLSGPSRSAPVPQSTAQAAATSSEEPPLRSYTIDLADELHTAAGTANTSTAAPQSTGPAQPTTIVESPGDPSGSTVLDPSGSTAPASSGPSTPAIPAGSTAPSTPTPQSTAVPAPRMVGPDGPPVPPQQPPSAHRVAQAPRSNTPETGGAWVVQLGVFAKHANADRLAQELKGKGFHAQVSEISVSGRALWRVRAGPVAEHAAAEQLNAKLRTAGHAGSVVQK